MSQKAFDYELSAGPDFFQKELQWNIMSQSKLQYLFDQKTNHFSGLNIQQCPPDSNERFCVCVKITGN